MIAGSAGHPLKLTGLTFGAFGLAMAEKWTERLMVAECAAANLGGMHESAPDAFLSALSTRDFGRFAECLAPGVQVRMLLPRGPEVRSGREEIARRFEGWFSPASGDRAKWPD